MRRAKSAMTNTVTKMTMSIKRLVWSALLGILLLPAIARAQDVVVYYHTDAIGSVRAMTDETGAVIHRYDFLPFSEAWDPPPNSDTRQFAGKERDRETGLDLDYFGARYHLPVIGRFTSVDPALDIQQALVDPQRWNRYAYSLNNPLKYTDPDGRSPTVLLGGISAVVFGGVTAAVNVYQGRAWHENVGVAAAAGFVVGATLGLAAPTIGAGSAATATATALEVGTAATGVVLSRRDQLLSAAQNPGLRDAINNLFRQNAKIGDGSSMAAYAYEKANGVFLSATGHGQKLIDRLGQLQRILKQEGLSAGDRAIAERLANEIKDVLQ